MFPHVPPTVNNFGTGVLQEIYLFKITLKISLYTCNLIFDISNLKSNNYKSMTIIRDIPQVHKQIKKIEFVLKKKNYFMQFHALNV